MPVASMTGFARGTGQDGPLTWAWETKSVNARGLDVRCRFPPGKDSLEPEVRRMVADRFARGTISVSLQLERSARALRLQVNRDMLAQVEDLVRELRSDLEVAAPTIDGLLNIRGVVDVIEEEDAAEEVAQRDAAILENLGETLDALREARVAEGARIAAVLEERLDKIEVLADAAAMSAALQPAAVRRRLEERIADVIDTSPALPEERIAHEVALLAAKADVREEIDRLRAHAAAARELLAQGGAVGRRLDFLCQEFNREGNTLCSKAADLDLTRIGLDLKAVIEQFREQVQNVE